MLRWFRRKWYTLTLLILYFSIFCMNKNVIFWSFGICIALVVGLIFLPSDYNKINKSKEVAQESKAVVADKGLKSINFETLEIANTFQQREKGLMNRSSLCPSCGMLFIFDKSQVLDFWMKNTQIPLDIIFFDEQSKIVKIYQNTIPLQTSPTYSSELKAKYVIETNAFFTRENNINIGDTLDISKLISSGTVYKSI
jgi:uncharacterized protein